MNDHAANPVPEPGRRAYEAYETEFAKVAGIVPRPWGPRWPHTKQAWAAVECELAKPKPVPEPQPSEPGKEGEKPMCELNPGDVVWFRSRQSDSSVCCRDEVLEAKGNVLAFRRGILSPDFPGWHEISRIQIVRVERDGKQVYP